MTSSQSVYIFWECFGRCQVHYLPRPQHRSHCRLPASLLGYLPKPLTTCSKQTYSVVAGSHGSHSWQHLLYIPTYTVSPLLGRWIKLREKFFQQIIWRCWQSTNISFGIVRSHAELKKHLLQEKLCNDSWL